MSNDNTNDIEIKDNSGLLNALEISVQEGIITEDDANLICYTQKYKECPEPIPLFKEEHHKNPYPIDSLPPAIKESVKEVAEFVQCPIPLVTTSALGVLSLAVQGLANVARAENLEGPINLYFIVIADSGERKTTVDKYFSKPIRKWETEQMANIQSDILTYTQEYTIWCAKCDGLKAAIKQKTISGRETTSEESTLTSLLSREPIKPTIPRLLYVDVTPESLAFNLATGWHSAGVISSEAGVVFGSHSMNKDSVMRNLSLLNILWDAGEFNIDRKSSERVRLKGARLTMSLAIQSRAYQAFNNSNNGLARGIGFSARFLLTNPKSTQGTRLFKKPPEKWIHLENFNDRIKYLLNIPPSVNEFGEIEPVTLQLSNEAKQLWIKFHDEVEISLKPGGDMEDAKDIASKSADNVARLAAQFYIFEHGAHGLIDTENMERAINIVKWHLHENKQFILESVLPIEIQNTISIKDWILLHCRKNNTDTISIRSIQQFGPNAFRAKKVIIEAAVALLVNNLYLFEIKQDNKTQFKINPRLLDAEYSARVK